MHYEAGMHMHNTVNVREVWTDTQMKKKWVQTKRDFPDHLVFVVNGNFFEFYHEDADVVTRTLKAPYMVGKVAKTGFPTSCYAKFAETLKREGKYKGICII